MVVSVRPVIGAAPRRWPAERFASVSQGAVRPNGPGAVSPGPALGLHEGCLGHRARSTTTLPLAQMPTRSRLRTAASRLGPGVYTLESSSNSRRPLAAVRGGRAALLGTQPCSKDTPRRRRRVLFDCSPTLRRGTRGALRRLRTTSPGLVVCRRHTSNPSSSPHPR